jgi:hypothetical protein
VGSAVPNTMAATAAQAPVKSVATGWFMSVEMVLGCTPAAPDAAVVVMVGVVSQAPGYSMTALSCRRRRLALPAVEVKSAPGYTPVAHALPSSRSAKYRGRRAVRRQPRATDAIVLGVVRV